MLSVINNFGAFDYNVVNGFVGFGVDLNLCYGVNYVHTFVNLTENGVSAGASPSAVEVDVTAVFFIKVPNSVGNKFGVRNHFFKHEIAFVGVLF